MAPLQAGPGPPLAQVSSSPLWAPHSPAPCGASELARGLGSLAGQPAGVGALQPSATPRPGPWRAQAAQLRAQPSEGRCWSTVLAHADLPGAHLSQGGGPGRRMRRGVETTEKSGVGVGVGVGSRAL